MSDSCCPSFSSAGSLADTIVNLVDPEDYQIVVCGSSKAASQGFRLYLDAGRSFDLCLCDHHFRGECINVGIVVFDDGISSQRSPGLAGGVRDGDFGTHKGSCAHLNTHFLAWVDIESCRITCTVQQN